MSSPFGPNDASDAGEVGEAGKAEAGSAGDAGPVTLAPEPPSCDADLLLCGDEDAPASCCESLVVAAGSFTLHAGDRDVRVTCSRLCDF